MTVHLGIDLGTTYSTVAAARHGRVELLSLGTRGAAVPSVVFVRDVGPPLVGEAAEARAQGDPSRFAREFKRRLGDPTPLILGGVPMGAERLSGFLLAYLVERASERLGEAPASVVLTHPASYTQYRLDLLGEAVRHAGLTNVRLLSEPRAAAVHYASDNRVQEGETVAVYDFGGGTFDTALVRLRGGEFELIGEPQGIDRFGGIDIDLAVFDYVCDEASDLVGGLDAEEPVNRAMLSRLRTDCRLAKERLSGDTETVVPVATPLGARDVVVTRRLLESMIRFRLADTVQALDRSVRTAGLNQSDVSRVLLVGGSSRIPLVRSLLSESFGRPISVDADPESAIALGAAAAAAQWAGGSAVAAGSPAPVFAAPVIPVAPPAEATDPAAAVVPDEPGPPAAPPPGPIVAEPVPADPPAATSPPATTPSEPPPPPRAEPEREELPPTPGTRPPAAPPGRRRRVVVIAVAAIAALLIAAVIVVLATRDTGDDSNSGEDGGSASPTTVTDGPATSSGDSTATTTSVDGVELSGDPGLSPPGGFTFEGLGTSDLESFRTLADVPEVGDELGRVAGATVRDADGSQPAAVVVFDGPDGDDLSGDAQQAIIDSIIGQESVVDDSVTSRSVGQIDGTEFATDDGGRGFVATRDGAVVLVAAPADGAAAFDQILTQLAAANGLLEVDTDETGAPTTAGTTTSIVFDIANVSFGNLNSIDPTINPPPGFHFEPLDDSQIPILQTSAALVGPTATSLYTVVGSPLFPDDGSGAPGGIMMYLGNGTTEFQQEIATALIDDGSTPIPFEVGRFDGTLFTRGDGTQGWVGPYEDSAILVSIDTVDADHVALKAVLDGLATANP